MKPIEWSCLLLSGAAMSGALLLGSLSASAHAAAPATSPTAQPAIEACVGKKEGETVTLPVANGKTVKAVCTKDKASGKLVARRSASVGPF